MNAKEELMYFKMIQHYFEAFEAEKVVVDPEIEIMAVSSRPVRYMIVHRKAKATDLLLTNMTGRMILDLCTRKATIGDIHQRMLSQFQTNIDPALVLLDIVKFVRMAQHRGIVHGSLT